MKSMRKENDSVFRRRLSNYSEEPDRDLWPQIAVQVSRVPPQWTAWIRRLSAFIIALSPALFLGFEIVRIQDASSTAKQVTTEASNPSVNPDRLCPEDRAVTRRNPATIDTGPSLIAIPGISAVASIPAASPAATNEWTHRRSHFDRQRTALSKIVDIEHVRILQAFDAVMDMEAKKVQVTEQPKKKEKHKLFPTSFDLYFTFMPTLGYQRIKSNRSDNILIQDFKPIPAFSKDRLGIRLEAGLQTIGSKRWKAYGGILYFQRHQTLEYVEKRVDSLIAVPPTQDGATLEPQFSLVPGSMDYDVKNIGLHFGLTYRLWDKDKTYVESDAHYFQNFASGSRKRFLHEVGNGIELHKSLKSTRAVSVAEGYADPSLYAFINLYYRLQYPRVGRLKAIFQPTFNYSFYINKDVNAPFYVKPYGFGLNLGCRYTL